jgi:hypothetical protein
VRAVLQFDYFLTKTGEVWHTEDPDVFSKTLCGKQLEPARYASAEPSKGWHCVACRRAQLRLAPGSIA